MTIGIYHLHFEGLEDWPYIGKSINIEKRYARHCWELNNSASSRMMLEAYRVTNGLPILNILEECLISELNPKEILWIHEFNSVHNGLNLTDKESFSSIGEDSFNSKVSNETVISIMMDITNTNRLLTDIAVKNNTTISIVNSIKTGSSHSWLKELYPKEHSEMLNKSMLGMWDAQHQGITYPKIVSPTGEVFEVTNVQKFSREHNICNSSLHQLLTGKRKSANKWKLAA